MGKYEEALARLNEAQKTAVTTTEGPVLVIAGPGTGKTQLLTTRIAHILTVTDTLPQNILCLTFTDSAAHTMRERLSDLIGQEAYDVTISTYHAFGSDLIRRFPEYFSLDGDLQPADDLIIDSIFREIIAELPYNNPLKYSDAYLGDIKTLISDAKRNLLAPADLRDIAQHNLHYIAQASPVVAETLGAIIRLTKKDMKLFVQLAERLRDLAARSASDDSTLPAQSRRPTAANQITASAEPSRSLGSHSLEQLLLESLDEATAAAARTGKTTPLTQWKNTWLARDSEAQLVVDGQKTNQKLLAAADMYEHYLTELKARRLFDYDDMILRAVRALETNNDLRFTLQERYLYILLDEFQDTNGAQLRIVELLTNNPVHEGRPNVLAVGDDDQAIYAFQGANYSHMLQFNQMYRDVLPVPLTQNYRSHANVLHLARGIAEQIEERLHHHFPQIEKTLAAANNQLPETAIVERREAQSDVAQFAWTARRIQKLIASGVPASEIAVLAPQHKYLEPLVPYLQRQGIAVHYDKRENILDDPAIVQLLRMSELVVTLAANETDISNSLWAEVLSFDFWGLSTSVIWRLSWQTADDDIPWSEALLGDEQLKPIALFFIRLSQLASSETLETMLDYLIGSTPLDLQEPGYRDFTSLFYAHYFNVGRILAGSAGDSEDKDDGGNATPAKFWELLTNLVVLRARLREYKRDADEPLYLKDLLAFTTAHQAAELKILNTSPYSSGTDAVQLMTAFKAKGMEFDAVFVLAVNDEAWGARSRGAGNRLSLPPNLDYIRYAGATNDERLRLFYVAVTRAKAQLYLLNYAQNYAGKLMNRLRYLNEQADGEVILSPLLPPGQQLVRPAEETASAPSTELQAYWQRRHETALTADDMRSLLQNRLRQFQLSPTHVNDFTDVIYGGPTAFFMRTILRFPVAQRPEMDFGNAMHETLEWMHHAAKQEGLLPSPQAMHRIFEQRLRRKRMSTHITTSFLERGFAALDVYLEQRGNTVAPDNVVEYNFRGEGVFIGDAHLTGKIDKLIVDKAKRRITIVDYKTGKSFGRWTREAKLHKYRQQLYLYKALVEGSHTFAGYEESDAYLEFVEPDDMGRIKELHVEFDDAEFARIKRLAERVWQCITQLELPDIEGYSADLAGIEAFERDLLEE